MAPAGTPHSQRLRPALIAASALAAVVASAWILQVATSGGAGETNGSGSPAYSVQIKQGGQVLRAYDLAALHALPQHTVVIDGKRQDGPLLTTVLTDAGARGYSRISVRGAGLRDGGRLKLTARQVRAGVQLDFSDRGTVKVCGPDLVWPAWVRDVLSIDVD